MVCFNKMFLMERSPFLGDTPKCNPLVLPTVIAGAASLVGGILNKNSTSNTNAANAANTERYNQGQLDLAMLNNRFNIEQWNRQNAYNTPAAQMQRYKEAGINPYMALSQVNSGNAESAVTGTMPNTAAPPNMIPKDYSFVGNTGMAAAQTTLNAMQALKTLREAKGQAIQNEFDLASLQDKLKKFKFDTDLSHWLSKDAHQRWLLSKNTYANTVQLSDLSVEQAKKDILNTEAQTAYTNAQTSLAKMQTNLTEQEYKKTEYYVQNMMPVEYENLKKQGELTDEQIKTELTKRLLNYANINLANSNARLAEMQRTQIDNLLDYQIAAINLENQTKQITYNIAYNTQGIQIEQQRVNFAKSGYYSMHSGSKIGFNAGRLGSFGFDASTDKNYNIFNEAGVKNFDASRWFGNQNLPPSKIKRKSSRYNTKHR